MLAENFTTDSKFSNFLHKLWSFEKFPVNRRWQNERVRYCSLKLSFPLLLSKRKSELCYLIQNNLRASQKVSVTKFPFFMLS